MGTVRIEIRTVNQSAIPHVIREAPGYVAQAARLFRRLLDQSPSAVLIDRDGSALEINAVLAHYA